MNEQELADLFSAQIDRILGGESAVDLAVDGDLPLLALGQQLSQVSFQASPAAQTTFESQLASWFGSASGLSATIFGLPKMLVLSLGAALGVMSAGLGLVVLISFIWTGAPSDPAFHKNPPAPAATTQLKPNAPVVISPAATRLPATTTPTATRPRGTSFLKDVLPTVTTSVGDTILLPTITPVQATPTVTATLTSSQSADEGNNGGSKGNSDSASDTSTVGDHDRGHGNDLDGYDEDNPGQSDGVSGGNDQNNGSGGISPGNLSGGSGGNSEGGNAGGSGNSNSGNGGGHGGGQGGGKGNN